MDSVWVDTWLSGATLDAGLAPGSIALSSYISGLPTFSSVAAGSGETSITYQWYRKRTVPTAGSYGEAIAGANSATYAETIELESGADYYYTRVVTDTYGRTGYDYELVEAPFNRAFKLDDWHIYANTKRRYY